MRQTLQELPGVAQVDIEFADRRADCKVDPTKFDAEDAVAKLATAGFENSTVTTPVN